MEQKPIKELYNLLLEQIKNKDHYDSGLISFFATMKQNIKIEDLLSYINKELDNKQIYFVRHAESKYNQWRQQSVLNWSIFYKNTLENIDPELTEKGIKQTRDLQQKIENEYKDLKFEAVYVSPLSRAVDTFGYLAYKQNENILINQFQDSKVIACHYLRERLDTSGDIGKDLDFVKNTLCKRWNINTDLINSNQWWSHSKFNEQKKSEMFKQKTEDFDKIQRRLIVILLLIIFSDDKVVCLVSHSNIYKCLMLKNKLESHGINNAQMKFYNKECIMKFLNKVIPIHIYKK